MAAVRREIENEWLLGLGVLSRCSSGCSLRSCRRQDCSPVWLIGLYALVFGVALIFSASGSGGIARAVG